MKYLIVCLFFLVGLEANSDQKPPPITSFSFEDSIYKSMNSESDELAIAFGGLGLSMGISIFEFKKTLSKFGVNIFLIRDLQREYYQYGLEPNGNISQALGKIKEEIDQLNPKRIVLFGSSSGGYAALLFGFLLLEEGYPVELVHAFAPKNEVRKQYPTYPYIEPEFFYLKDIFERGEVPKGIFHIYYAMDSKPDIRYALKHLNFDWIEHHRFNKGGHKVIMRLKQEGILDKIVEDSLK